MFINVANTGPQNQPHPKPLHPQADALELLQLNQISLKGLSEIWDFLQSAKEQLLSQSVTWKLKNLKKQFSVSLTGCFAYKFTDGDVTRMMKRLEDLQKELHKKVLDLSTMYVLWGDAGIMLGKFGEDTKPFVDRCREIMGIAFRAQARTESLPSDSKRLAIASDATPPALE